MTSSPGSRRRHLATSPFPPELEPIIEKYELDDRVCHDLYGLGRVVGTEANAVTVDFGSQTVRITSPFHKLQPL